MPGFFSRLSYSFGNEDWHTEQLALRVAPGNRTICVTGSGDRALHCLLSEGAEVHAIDANPIQSHLLELKVAALRQLDFSDYLGFLGAAPSSKRARHLPELASHMCSQAASCWLSRKAMIEKGIIYQGHMERRLKTVSTIIGALRGKKVERLFASEGIEQQRELVDREWNSWSWRAAFDVILHPRLALGGRWIRDPGLLKQIPTRLHVGRYLCQRINAYLHRNLAKESLLLSLFLLGHVKAEGLPPYLTAQGAEIIRTNLDRLKITTGNIIEHLHAVEENSIDRFSLSDVASYMSESHFHQLVRGVYRSARPGARFCMRQFLSDHPLPPELVSKMPRELPLEAELENRDRCPVYRYMVGTVVK